MKKEPKDCQHEEFRAIVGVHRILDAGKFMADIRITCVECDEPFRFVGAPAGVNYDQPMVSIDGLELRAPIEPELETRLHATASFQMPAIPKRH